jgi:hypothetical protein
MTPDKDRKEERKAAMTKRVATYNHAIEWIARNDDTSWLDDEYGSASVTLCLVADVFYRSVEEATADLRRAIERDRSAQAGLEQARAYARSVIAKLPA